MALVGPSTVSRALRGVQTPRGHAARSTHHFELVGASPVLDRLPGPDAAGKRGWATRALEGPFPGAQRPDPSSFHPLREATTHGAADHRHGGRGKEGGGNARLLHRNGGRCGPTHAPSWQCLVHAPKWTGNSGRRGLVEGFTRLQRPAPVWTAPAAVSVTVVEEEEAKLYCALFHDPQDVCAAEWAPRPAHAPHHTSRWCRAGSLGVSWRARYLRPSLLRMRASLAAWATACAT